MITISAPAKINLTLEVLGKRPDGYHEIRSIMQTVSLSDTLSFEPADGLSFGSDMPEWSAEKSILSKAAELLRKETGARSGASIFIQKRIPLLSGLGGDSSDAAATLMGLASLWGLGLSHADLSSLGQQLGSDVVFFFYGGTALAEGRGEIVSQLPGVAHEWIVLALPPVPRLPGKTKSLYQALTANHYTAGQITQAAIRDIEAGRQLAQSSFFNTFENVAFALQPELETARQHILKIGARAVHLAGSGPTVFVVCNDRAEAEELAARLIGQQIRSYVVETTPAQYPQRG
jgi:4-diphosphocytidyl-2-C-methyl-D-erythritol kinase